MNPHYDLQQISTLEIEKCCEKWSCLTYLNYGSA